MKYRYRIDTVIPNSHLSPQTFVGAFDSANQEYWLVRRANEHREMYPTGRTTVTDLITKQTVNWK